jgi:hypothetical protein
MLKRLIIAGVMAAPLSVMAVTVQGQASATIELPIAVVQTTPIQFGSIVDTTGAGGIINLDHDGYAVPNAGNLVCDGNSVPGSFHVTGVAHTGYTVAVAPTQFNITGNNPGDTMQVNITFLRFSSALGLPVATNLAMAGATDGAGHGDFNTRATLTVGAAQPAGNYNGTYNVTVLHQ